MEWLAWGMLARKFGAKRRAGTRGSRDCVRAISELSAQFARHQRAISPLSLHPAGRNVFRNGDGRRKLEQRGPGSRWQSWNVGSDSLPRRLSPTGSLSLPFLSTTRFKTAPSSRSRKEIQRNNTHSPQNSTSHKTQPEKGRAFPPSPPGVQSHHGPSFRLPSPPPPPLSLPLLGRALPTFLRTISSA